MDIKPILKVPATTAPLQSCGHNSMSSSLLKVVGSHSHMTIICNLPCWLPQVNGKAGREGCKWLKQITPTFSPTYSTPPSCSLWHVWPAMAFQGSPSVSYNSCMASIDPPQLPSDARLTSVLQNPSSASPTPTPPCAPYLGSQRFPRNSLHILWLQQ